MFEKSGLSALALATSTLLFAFDANAQNLTIECDAAMAPEESDPVTLDQYICQLAMDGVVATLGEISSREEVKSEHLRKILIRQSTTAMYDPNEPNTITITKRGSFESYMIHETNDPCKPPPVFYKDRIGNYERRWCDSSTGSQKQATVDVYYRFPNQVLYTGSYIYHCGHPEEGDMPSKVRQTVC